MGDCTENERVEPNGDVTQHTSNGLLVWRKGDGYIAFTDGAQTWIRGPNGIETRPNSQHFAWEALPTATPTLTPGTATPASATTPGAATAAAQRTADAPAKPTTTGTPAKPVAPTAAPAPRPVAKPTSAPSPTAAPAKPTASPAPAKKP